jgi:hypothetical protein
VTVPARVREADILRALRSAKKLGAKSVRIEPDGSIDIVLQDDKATGEEPAAAPLPEPPCEVETLW